MKNVDRILGNDVFQLEDAIKDRVVTLNSTLTNKFFTEKLLSNHKTVFVDTENISNYSFVSELTFSDELNLIYTVNSNSIRIPYINNMFNIGVQPNFLLSPHGTPNALDFFLITVVTEYIVRSENCLGNINIYIVSNDKGYHSSIKYLKSKYRNLNIFMVSM